MKKTILSIFLTAMAMAASAQAVGDAFYIYRNDGGFNAFFREEVDSITWSNYDNDSIYYDDIVTQVVYTPDSIYRIPLAAIDSVGFVTPKTVYRPGVRVVDALADHVISADSLSFVLSQSTPNALVPLLGEKIVTTELTEGFPEGFAGEVTAVEKTADGILVKCDRVAITDIYEVYYGTTADMTYTAPESGMPRKAKKWDRQGAFTVSPGRIPLDLRSSVSGQYQVTEELALRFTPDLAFAIEPSWRIRAFVIVTPETGLYSSAVCTADYILEERLGGAGTLSWQKDFPIPVVSQDHIPVVPPYLYFYDKIGAFIRADFTVAAQWQWQQHYRQVHVFEYSSRGEQMLRRPSSQPQLVSSSHGYEGLVNGTVALGGFIELGFTLVDRRIDRVDIRGEYGVEASAQAVLYKRNYEEASRSTALYEQMRNCGFVLNRFWNISVEAAAGPWGVDWTPLHGKKELWRMSYVPQFSGVSICRGDNKTEATASMQVSGKCLNEVGVGLTLVDDEEDDNRLASGFATYGGIAKNYQYVFKGVTPSKTYTLYPTVKAWDYTMLATPSSVLDKAGMPVKITSFKQTGSQYKADGFSHDGRTYDYKYDVAVTVEIESTDGVADWGYVYRDPYGHLAHISLKDHGSPYTDTRYAYYRDESKSTVTLYEYVKYDGENEYYYGEPVDFPVQHSQTFCPDDHHPHMIDLGLPSGTKWACCNVGATTPEGYGGYYAWGETEEKSVYNDVTYQYSTGTDTDGDGWYDRNWSYQYLGTDIAGTQYDVAHVKWGGSWAMPSLDQIKELLNNCSSRWTTQNGVNGRVFTGTNGGSIFLPAAGYRCYDYLGLAGSGGYYWSSTQTPSYSYHAYFLYFESGGAYWYGNWSDYYDCRYLGLAVRPVSR